MNKDNEIKISLNLEKLVKDSSNDDNISEINKDKSNIFDEKELEQINNVSINKEEIADKKTVKRELKKNKGLKNKKHEGLDDSLKILNKHNKKLQEQRVPRIGKTLNEIKNEQFQKMQEKNEKTITIKKLITSIIIIIVIILLYLFMEYAPILGIRLPTKLSKEINIDVVSTDSDIYDLYDNELLVYSNHTISTYNKKGKKTWEHTLDTSFSPEIYIHGKYMAISNNSNGIIYLFNDKKEILNMKVDGKIEYIYMDNNGNMAVEYATNSYKKIIGVYDRNGKNKYNTYLEYTAIVDIELLDKANKLLIIQADSNSFKIGCSINLLDGTTGEKNMQQILKLDNNFVYNVKQINNELILLLDDKVIKYNIDTGEQKELKEFDSSQILFISLLDKYYISVEKSLDDNSSYNIITKDYNNVEISTTNIENSPKFVVNNDNLNYCIYQNKLQVINKWGIEVLTKDLTIVPKNIIIFNNNKSAALVYTNEIQIINL